MRLQHSLVTHHLPLYFPEAERYLHSSRAEWFTELLLFTPCPTAVRPLHQDRVCRRGPRADRGTEGRQGADGSPTSMRPLAAAWDCRCREASETMRMFRVVLEEYRALCQLRKRLEADIVTRFGESARLCPAADTARESGRFCAMIILAEARDLRRFGCVATISQVLRLGSLHRAIGPVSRDHTPVEAGNARLRYAFWMAGTVAIRMQQNSFRRKFDDYIRRDPHNADRRRKGLHGRGGQDGPRRVRRGHHRHRLSPLPGSDETRREDPFARGRRGACDLVDNARTFHWALTLF